MFGPDEVLSNFDGCDPALWGLVPRATEQLFEGLRHGAGRARACMAPAAGGGRRGAPRARRRRAARDAEAFCVCTRGHLTHPRAFSWVTHRACGCAFEPLRASRAHAPLQGRRIRPSSCSAPTWRCTTIGSTICLATRPTSCCGRSPGESAAAPRAPGVRAAPAPRRLARVHIDWTRRRRSRCLPLQRPA
eukprot:7388717-Prymnesium_polylepis.2